jgi:MerR family transcriptional regulator/heat shock protein HspR
MLKKVSGKAKEEFFKRGLCMKIKRKPGYFSISAVAKMFSVHQQTIRLYEREGLICPKRSDGNTRLFSDEDIDRLEEIIYLTHELGINLAGVEVIFKLKKQIKKMQQEMNKLFDQTQSDLDQQTEESKQVIQKNVKQLMTIKKESTHAIHRTDIQPIPSQPDIEPIVDMENWEIEYEE